MQVIHDGWTPLFKSLKLRVQPMGRTILLSRIISRMEQITKGTLGATGTERPIEWMGLRGKYKKKIKRDYATLIMTDIERRRVGKRADKPHLKDQFSFQYNADSATLRNDSIYASVHQNGEGDMPPRPFFPVLNNDLTPYAYEQMRKILDGHFTV